MRFTIRDSERHAVIELDIVDLKLKKRFNLDRINFRGEEDKYTQFYFSEASRFAQKSISWVALLHTIIFHSEIRYGPATRYDLECALSYVRRNSILFPKESIRILSDILNAIQEWGYYIFVEVHNDNEKDTECYIKDDSYTFFVKTEIGICKCNQDRVLVDFIPSLEPQSFFKNNLPWPIEIRLASDSMVENLHRRYPYISPNIIDWLCQGVKNCNSNEALTNRDEAEPVIMEEKLVDSENEIVSDQLPSIQTKNEKAIESEGGRDSIKLTAYISRCFKSIIKYIFNRKTILNR